MGNCYMNESLQKSIPPSDIVNEEQSEISFDFSDEKNCILTKNKELTDYVKFGVEQIIINENKNYQGEISQGKANGKGIFTSTNNYQYNGDWAEGRPNGFGVQNFENGDYYEGGFKDGFLEGKGQFKFINGKYIGEFKKGRYDGEGYVKWNDGREYRGSFKNGTFHGQGRFVNKDKNVYEGSYLNGKKDGNGIFNFVKKEHQIRGVWKEGEFVKGSLFLNNKFIREFK